MTEGVAERTERGVGRFNLYHPDFLLLVVDLMGVCVFAVEGALAAIRSNLDKSFPQLLGENVKRYLSFNGVTKPAAGPGGGC